MATRRIPDPKIGGSIPSEVITIFVHQYKFIWWSSKKYFHAGIWTRVLWVKTTYPNQLDYTECLQTHTSHTRIHRVQVRVIGLVVWFLLWVQEVTGSIPVSPHLLLSLIVFNMVARSWIDDQWLEKKLQPDAGLEPATSRLRACHSTDWVNRARTLHAVPLHNHDPTKTGPFHMSLHKMMASTSEAGFEPATFCLGGRRAIHCATRTLHQCRSMELWLEMRRPGQCWSPRAVTGRSRIWSFFGSRR